MLHFARSSAEAGGVFPDGEGATYVEAIDKTDALIDGFQSPLGMEALATVDWLLSHEKAEPTVEGIRKALNRWPTPGAAERKQKLLRKQAVAGGGAAPAGN